MSRIKNCFENLAGEGRKALIPFVTAGDPTLDVTVPLMHALVEQGADILELGVPFSDPMADGPVIQLASERSLEHNTSLTNVIEMVSQFREKDTSTPVVLMGYLNPVEAMGYEVFVDKAASAGVDGVLMVDMPPEESGDFKPMLDNAGIDMIFLIAPTTTEERIGLITSRASGYIYYVSLKGVTGASTLNVDSVAEKLETIRNITDLPVAVGFGIKDAESAAKVSGIADGVVVGSALVNKVASLKKSPEKITSEVPGLIGEMRSAMNQA